MRTLARTHALTHPPTQSLTLSLTWLFGKEDERVGVGWGDAGGGGTKTDCVIVPSNQTRKETAPYTTAKHSHSFPTAVDFKCCS